MFPALDRESFDRFRHDRTDAYLSTETNAYRDQGVVLVVDSSVAQTYAGQLLTLLAANLALRLFRNLRVDVRDEELDPRLQRDSCTTLWARLEHDCWLADPFATPFGREMADSFAIHLGAQVSGRPADLVVGSQGWLAHATRTGRHLVPDVGDNPVGAAMAACVGVAEALKHALNYSADLRVTDTSFSLWDFTAGPGATQGPVAAPRLGLGRILMVGAGSVGSNLAFLLDAHPVDATLDVVDHDVVKAVNLDRSVLFGIADLGWNKADVVTRWLGDRVPTRSHTHTYDEYVLAEGRRPNGLDLLLPLANEFGVRWAIANSIPPLSVYGTTRADWGANLGRHIPIAEPCLGCRFGVVEKQPSYVCASGALEERPQSSEANDAALPFLSMAAAVLAFAELLKLQQAPYPANRAFVDVDFKGPMEFLANHDRHFRAGCVCRSISREAFVRFNGETRYATLSMSSSSIQPPLSQP